MIFLIYRSLNSIKEKHSKLKSFESKIDKLNEKLKKTNLLEIGYLIGSKKQIFIRNFLAGISRGIGIGIGVTLLSAILIFILQKIVLLNIPIIGDYITDIVQIVQNNTNKI